MADIKQINLAGTTYDLVDDTAVHSVSISSSQSSGTEIGTITIDGTTTTFYDASSIVALPVSYSDWTWNTSNSDEANIAGLLQTAYNLYGSNNYYKTARELHIFNGTAGDWTIQLIVRFPNSWTFSKLSAASAAWPDGAFGVPNLSGQVYILNSYSNDADDRYLLFSTSETGTGEVGYKIIDLTNPEYVQQNAVTTTATTLPVMLGYSGVTTAVTNTLNKTDSLKYNPSTKLLQTGALGVISGVGYTTVLPTTTNGYENGQIMFVVFDET